jgi:hypothetical protein
MTTSHDEKNCGVQGNHLPAGGFGAADDLVALFGVIEG